jgi:hypothetical protein
MLRDENGEQRTAIRNFQKSMPNSVQHMLSDLKKLLALSLEESEGQALLVLSINLIKG